MTFKLFAEKLAQLEKTAGRNEITVILAELFKTFAPEEITAAMYLITARVAPAFLPIEFSFSTKLLVKSLAQLSNRDEAELLKEYKVVGDIGDFTQKLLELKNHDNNTAELQVLDVAAELAKIAFTSGKNAQTLKNQIFLQLLTKVTPLEAKFLVRILSGNLRLGLSTKTLLDALSWALAGDKSLRPLLEHAYGVSVDLGVLAQTALIGGKAELEKISVHPGVPIAAKLVEREHDITALFERMGTCYIQPKFDGLRVQIHYNRNGFDETVSAVASEPDLFNTKPEPEKVRVFSRNLENLTAMVPDLVAAVQNLGVDSIVLDGEALGIDWDKDSFLPFQETIKRKRKYQVNEMVSEVPLQANVFDVLYLNGVDLIKKPLNERYQLLEKLLHDNQGKQGTKERRIKLCDNTEVKTAAEIETLFTKYTGLNMEGIIAKNELSTYDPGSRNFDWIKLKASTDSKLVDTIDAIVLGYYQGEGTRAKFGIGAILIGIYDPDNDNFVSLAKVGTGFKDADWAKIKATLDPLKLDQLPANVFVEKSLLPDVPVIPQIVVVVEADSISLSKIHGRNPNATDIGLSIRFPRIKLFGRDKSPEDATTIKELRTMFELQQSELSN